MNKITRSLLFLIPVFFLFFNACTSENIDILETSTSKKYKVPTLQKTKAYFEERENIFTNDLKAANNDNTLSIDWQNSFPITYKESQKLDILYSPVKYTTSARVKSFVASVETENTIESEIITVAYDKTHRNDKGLTGVVFRHTIEGEPIAFYKFKEGYKIDFNTNVTKSSGPNTKDISDCLGYYTIGEILEMIEAVGVDNVVCVEVGGGGGGEDTDPWGDPWSEQDPLNGTPGEPSSQEPSFGGGNTFDNWWEEIAQILFDSSFDSYPCQKNIVQYQHLNKSELSQFIMSAFGGDQSKVNLTYKVEDLENDLPNELRNGEISDGEMDANQNLDLTISLDTQAAEEGSDLLIATVIIHENVHALLTYMDGIVDFNITSDNPSLSELAEAYAKWKGNPNNPQQTTEDTEHFYMTELVNEMADALQAFGDSEGYNIQRSYYEALSWSNDMKVHAKEEIQSAIDNAYLNERLLASSSDSEGNPYAKGEKCN